MATQPDPAPDRIEPGTPAETPPPFEQPAPGTPDEAPGIGPDIDEPGTGPDEVPKVG